MTNVSFLPSLIIKNLCSSQILIFELFLISYPGIASNNKLSMILEFWDFLKTRMKWWLGPIVLIMLLMGLLIVFTQGSAVAPFIYTLF